MKEKEEWVFFKEIEWNDPKFNRFSIDTRDFHCGYHWQDKNHNDWEKLKNIQTDSFLQKKN